MPTNLAYSRRLDALADLPEIPAIPKLTCTVQTISAELAEECGLIQCDRCQHYFAAEQMARPGTRFSTCLSGVVIDYYRDYPHCLECASERGRERNDEELI